jgi:dihydroneopterin aldolase
MGKILLEGMEFFAYHGVYEEEREKGQNFSIDLEILADYSKACYSDKLEDAIDYVQVYELVKAEMAIPSSLLENVAQRIIDSIQKSFEQIEGIKVKITKLQPPISGKLKGISIELEFSTPSTH